MSLTIHIQAKSKKEINEKLAQGKKVYGESYSLFGGGGTYELNKDLPTGTVIKIFEKYVSGNPFVKSYGTWAASKNKVI